MVNSVSLERPQVIDVVRQAKASVIAGAAGETTMPTSVEERMSNLDELFSRLSKAGIEEHEIYFDPLVFPISVDSQHGNHVFQSIAQLRGRFGEKIHFAPGLSNISFGMPSRKLLNQVFTFICREKGLDGGIVDPLQINTEALSNLDPDTEPFRLAKAVLVGEDDFGMNFITAAREGAI
jgi:5-methyltetrahydrofolate--homocysteine methyltransferase